MYYYESFFAALLVILFVILAGVLVFYILRSIGFMTLARNRGMANPWLIWIPIVGVYTVGAVADDINAREGQTTYFRWMLLGGSILSWVFSNFGTVAATMDMITNPYSYGWNASVFGSSFFGNLISLALYVVQILALNKIFKCYRPFSATAWTVLCAIPFTAFMQSIFPFVIRNSQPNWVNPPAGYYPPQGGYDPYGQQQWQAPPQAPPQNGGWQPGPDDRQPPYNGQ